jgi:hypothetical protein
VLTEVVRPVEFAEVISGLVINGAPIPAWAQFHIGTGQRVYQQATGREGAAPVRIVLALPTRAYAAAFVALGAVLASLSQANDAASVLAGLPSGTTVTIKSGERYLRGVFLGVEEYAGGVRYVVQVGKHGTNRYPESFAKHIQPSEQSQVKLPKLQQGRKIISDEFLSQLLGKDEAWQYSQSTSCASLVITQKLSFEEEVSQSFLTLRGRETHRGKLDSLLRVQSSSVTEGYKTCVVATAEDESNPKDAPVVIFDGARAFLRHHHFYSHRSWVVLLDRCETSFIDAAAQLQQLYVNRVDDWTTLEPPHGVEYMSFLGA